MLLTVNDVIISNDNKDEINQEQFDTNSHFKEESALQIKPSNKEEIKAATINVINMISRNNKAINQAETTGLSFASGFKKSAYTILSERAIDHLFNTGQLPNNLDYDSLIQERNSNTTHHSKRKEKGSSKRKENRKAVINNFLSRNQLYKNAKDKRNINHHFNDLNKSNLNLNKVSQNEGKNKTHLTKNTIRSPKQFLSDQTVYVDQKNKKIDELRKTIQEKELKENKSKPIISLKSKEIAKRALSVNSNKKSQEIHIKLYEDMKQRAINKEKLKQRAISLEQQSINKHHNRKLSQNDLKVCVHQLYQKGVDQLKVKTQNDIPCHMEKVSLFYSRDYSSYQSNIRTNMKQEMSLIDSNDNESKIKRKLDMDKVSLKNKLLLRKKLNQEIYNELSKINKPLLQKDANVNGDQDSQTENDKDNVCYSKYCQLLFNLGFIQYDHIHFRQYIKNFNYIKPDENILIDYNSSDIDALKLRDMVVTNSKSTKEISKCKLIKEQDLIYRSWKLLCGDNKILKADDDISLNSISLFLFCIMGLYIGEASDKLLLSIEKGKEGGISDESNSTLAKDLVNQDLIIASDADEMHKKCLISSSKVMKYDQDKAKTILQTFRKFAENRLKYESNRRKKRKSEKVANYSSSQSLTFKPSINGSNKASGAPRLKLEETYDIIQKRKNGDIERLQKEKALNELKNCTFNPNNRPKKKRKISEISNRLYSYSKSTKRNKKRSNTNDKDIKSEYTFSPRVNKPVNESLFEQKSIKNDPIVSNKIKQYEKARIEKKVIDLLSEKGRTGFSNITTTENLFNELEKEEKLSSFKFDLERKQCKDTFDNFASNERQRNDFKKVKKEQPMFTIEVKIKERVELLHYYKTDNPVLITQRFCKRNNLGESSNEKIFAVIEEKLSCNDQY